MRYEIRTKLSRDRMLENIISFTSKTNALRSFDWLERHLSNDGEVVALYRLVKGSYVFVAASLCYDMEIRFLNTDPFNL